MYFSLVWVGFKSVRSIWFDSVYFFFCAENTNYCCSVSEDGGEYCEQVTGLTRGQIFIIGLDKLKTKIIVLGP